MFIWRLIEFALFVLFILGVVTQIIIPGLKDRPFFPIFRRRKVERDLALANDLVDQAEAEKEINKQVKKAAKISREG